ncbi:MAG: BON domain-containing protein [Anaerolineales bacterium]|nr:BON domain-containing protein [Anaerolineales bacterium]
MSHTELHETNKDEFSRCEERGEIKGFGKSQQNDSTIKEAVYQALWMDNVLRAIEYYEIDVHVKNGIVYLYGHIVGKTSQLRIMNAIRTVPGMLGTISHLVLDDRLTLDVAESLGELERTYACKFFTGTSHGVVSLNGNVSDQKIKILAEKCAAANPNVRGVMNHVHVLGVESDEHEQPFLQPEIGKAIYFSDGVSGVVKQVIINPNNRRVTAMIILGKFSSQQQELESLKDENARLSEQLIVVPMNVVRYLTKVSGFLYITSKEKSRYMEFDPSYFFIPKNNWMAPYPYCPNDVLFSVEYQVTDHQIVYGPDQLMFKETLGGASFKEQFFSNDSLA